MVRVRLMLFLAHLFCVSAVISQEVFFELQPSVTTTPRTLVLHDTSDDDVKKSHSKFFNALQARGHTLTYHKIDAPLKKLLVEYDELVYDNVLLFVPSLEKFPRQLPLKKRTQNTQQAFTSAQKKDTNTLLALKHVLDFVDQGGNVFVGTASVVGSEIRKLANECGIDFHVEESNVIDHVARHPSKDNVNHTLVYSGAIRSDNRPVTGNTDGSKVLFRGVGQTIGQKSLAFSILHGSPSSYSSGPGGIISSAEETTLVSALQSRNGARVLFGSIEMCSDGLYALSDENVKFCDEVGKWAFREKAVLRWDNLTSHKVGEEHIGTPYMYRMKDEVVFKIDIREYENGNWKPYQGKDVQLELVMMDPYIRTFLDAPTSGSTFTKTLKTPDKYGIFKWKILYKRRGYNQIHVEHLAPLRNFKHNDYDRFLWVASPYYAVCLVTPFTVVAVAFLFLYHREHKESKIIKEA